MAESHERQEQVWDQIKGSYNCEPYFIRRKMTEDTVRASDKRVRFVTLDAYVAAGGYVLRDLFETDDGGWLHDVTLLDRLVDEKLKAEGERIGAEGWKWVAVAVDFPYGHTFGMREIDGEPVPLTDDDEARITALREEADRLEDEWSGSDEIPDEVAERITAIDEEIAVLVARPLVYDAEEQTRAGAFVSIDVDGSLHIERGYVRADDEPAESDADEVERAGDDDEIGEAAPAGSTIVTGMPGTEPPPEEDEQDDLLRPLPDRLVTELTAYRTVALRDAFARSPQVAFAAVLHALVLDTFYTCVSGETCLQLSIRNPYLGSHAPGLGDCPSAKAIDARHEAWSERLPEAPTELWDTLSSFDADEQAALFAHCASFGINALCEPATRYNEGRVSERTVTARIAHSHILAREIGLDMVAAGWTATVDNYLGRVTKPRMLIAVEEARGAEAAGRLAGLKKPEMAKAAEELLAASGWLAEPLRTPIEETAANDGEQAVDADDTIDDDVAAEEEMTIAAE